MTVLKRPDRKQRPWYYKFRLEGGLHKECGFRTQKEAQDAEAAERLRLQSQKTRITFSQMVKLRLDYVQAACTSQTYRQNVTRLKPFKAWKILDLSEITPDMVRTRLVELSKTMSNSLANKHLVALKSVFEQAVNDGHLGRNPCRGVKFLPVERRAIYVPSVAEIEAVLALAGELDRAYLVTIWQLGARVREVNNLPWQDVDFRRHQVRLWTRKKRGGNKTARLVDMNDRAFAALKLSQWHRLPGSSYVFTNPHTGRPWDYRDKFFDRLCRLAGGPGNGVSCPAPSEGLCPSR
jgi:integrase